MGSAMGRAIGWAIASGAVSTNLPSAAVVNCGSSVTIGSATRTAPPVMRATPAAVAESFATANLIDMSFEPCLRVWLDVARPHLHQFQCSDGIEEGFTAMRLTTFRAA
jgi:hypothetical protein